MVEFVLIALNKINLRNRKFELILALAAGLALAFLPVKTGMLLVGACVFMVLVVAQPLAGLAVAAVAAPLGAWEKVFVAGPVGVVSSGQLLLWLVFGAWLLRGIVLRRLRLESRRRVPLLGMLALFCGVALLSLVSAEQTVSVWDGVKELGKWLELAWVLWIVVDEYDWLGAQNETRAPKRFLFGLVALLLAVPSWQALLGIWQYRLRGVGPEHFLISEGVYRASGTFQQPNPFGGYINWGLLLALGLLIGGLEWLWTAWRKGRDWRPALLTVVAASLMAAVLMGGLLSSWSRGAWLSFAAALVAMVLFLPRRRVLGVGLAVSGLLGFLLAIQFGLLPLAVEERLFGFLADFELRDVRGVDINDTNFSVLERMAHWQSALGMAREDLWTGVGFGNYETAYPDYDFSNWPSPLGHAHNYYLNLLAEVGVLGLLAYLALWAAIGWRTVRVVAKAVALERGLALGLLGAWAALSTHHFLDNLYVNNNFIYLGLMLGLLVILERRTEKKLINY